MPARSITEGSSRRTERRPSVRVGPTSTTGSRRSSSKSRVPRPRRRPGRTSASHHGSPAASGSSRRTSTLPARLLPEMQPRREHRGLVDHQDVARTKQQGQIGHRRVVDPTVGVESRPDQQPGRAPRLGGGLCDGFFGKLVVVTRGQEPLQRSGSLGLGGGWHERPRRLCHRLIGWGHLKVGPREPGGRGIARHVMYIHHVMS